MAGEEKKAIVIEILGDASKFGAAAKAAIEEAMKGMQSLGVASTDAGQKMKDGIQGGATAAEQMGMQLKMVKALMDQYGLSAVQASQEVSAHFVNGKKAQDEYQMGLLKVIASTQDFDKATREAAQKAVEGMKAATAATGQWGTALKAVKAIMGLIGITSLIGILRSFMGLLKESTEVAAEFSFNVYRLQVGIRAAQREFGAAAGTMEEWSGFIMGLRKQFQIFSLVDLTAATAKVILLTRELGFTKDQMQEVTKASIILAEISGRDVEDAARRLALFLDTGYARGLAQLGVQISKVSVEQYALAHGINKTWDEMTRAERAAIGLNAVLEQTSRLEKDAGKAALTLQGQFMALRATQKDAMIEIGTESAFLFLMWERGKTLFISEIVPAISKALSYMVKLFIGVLGVIVRTWAMTWSFMYLYYSNFWNLMTGKMNISDLLLQAFTIGHDAQKTWIQTFKDMLFPVLDLANAVEEYGSLVSSMLEESGDAAVATEDDFKKFGDDVRDVMRDAAEAVTDMKLSMERDFEDLSTKLERDFTDAFTDLLRDLEDVEIDYNNKRAELIAKAAEDEKKQTAENVDRRAEMLAEYRLREIQAQREFNIEMAQLEREYLLSLEDAVRERDARGVLMLMRKHNLEVQSRNEDFDEKRRQAKENLDLELAQLRQAEARKRQEIRNSLKLELADLQRDMYLKAQEKYRNYLQELEDIKLNGKREREDLNVEYDRREKDLDRHLRNRLTILGKRFAEEFGLTALFVKDSTGLLRKLAGAYSSVLVQGLLAGAQPPPVSGMTLGGTRVPSRATVPWPGTGHAEGGLSIAKKPTPAIFGEAGPEAAMFIPLNRLKEMGGGFGGGGRDRIALDINVEASPELVVSIIDQTMSEVAEVITRAGR